MITDDGKLHIKRYMAGFVPGIAQSIAFGIGGAAEAATHLKLQFEVGRSDIALTSYDFVNDKLIFKAPVAEEFGGSIHEVALFSLAADSVAGEFGSKVLTTFDSATEDWTDTTSGLDAVFSTANVRLGADGLSHTPAASAFKVDELGDVSLDLSGYSAADKFVLSLNSANANVIAVSVRFATDAANYYSVNFNTPNIGYNILESAKGAAVAVGTPDWQNISAIQVSTESGATGASDIVFDGLRIEDLDTVNSDYVMVARESLSTPFVKQEGKSQEIEFSMDVNIT